MCSDRLWAGSFHVDRDVDDLNHRTHVAIVIDNLLARIEARIAHTDDLRAHLGLLGVGHNRAQEVRSDPAHEDGRHVVAPGDKLVLGELHARLLRDFNVGVVIQVAVAVKIAPAHGNRRCVDRSFGHFFSFEALYRTTLVIFSRLSLGARKPNATGRALNSHSAWVAI